MFSPYILLIIGSSFLLYQFYQVEVHQTAVERTLRLDASEFALLFLCAEKIIEAIALVESEVALLVVGINKQETTASLIERVNKPSLDETENVAAKMSALEIDTYSQTANHDSGDLGTVL